MAKKGRNDDFNKLVEKAENANTYELRAAAFEDVIDADGSYSDAYLKLIELYKNDHVFDEKEVGQILRLINENVNELKKGPRYEEVAYELGILYWYYYFYGGASSSESNTAGKIAAVKWFREAQTAEFRRRDPDRYDIAHVYCTIGDFYSQTQKKENELLKKNYSQELWEGMKELSELVETANAGSDIIILETYKTVINLENTNMNEFSRSGISLAEQKSLMEKIIRKTEKINAEGDSAREAKEYILRSYDSIIEMIDGSE